MSVVDDVKTRLDIVETASGYVSLQKSGRNFKALCPFHTEKTPSFIVNAERQTWRCFGACATGGDVLSFVMRMEGMEFGDALRLLAQRAGVALSESSSGGGDRHEALYRVNQAAGRFYQEYLESSSGQRAKSYLAERGVDDETRSRFELGLSPDTWTGLKSHLLALGFEEEQAIEAGLLRRSDDGSTRDFFKGRLMFAIHDRQSRIAGFGARALDDSMPKYLNTATTPIFDKRSILYGLHLAAGPIRTEGTAIVVEGYMDVIAAHQFGYTNVVASMGTALTGQQVSQLKTMASNFVLGLDPDTAGQEATLRSLTDSWRVLEGAPVDNRRRSVGVLYQRDPQTLKIASLPQGRDPDSLIREAPDEWERLTKEATPLMEYLIAAVAARFDVSTGQGKARAAEALAPLIASASFVEQDHYTRKLAAVLEVSEDAVRGSIGGLARGGERRGQRRARAEVVPGTEVNPAPIVDNPEDSLDDYTLALLLERPELKERARGFAPEYFHKSEDREVYTRWLDCSTIDDLRDSLDQTLRDQLTYLTQKELFAADRRESEAALEQCFERLERRHILELQEVLLASEDAGAPPPRDMEDVVSGMNERLKELSARRPRGG